MNDILPPHRRTPRVPSPAQSYPEQLPPVRPGVVTPIPVVSVDEVVEPATQPPEDTPPHRRRVPRWAWWVSCALIVLAAIVVAAWLYYQHELQPLSRTALSTTRVTIVENSSPSQISQLLHEKHLIRSAMVFDIYTRLNGSGNKLQAGTYNLSTAMSLPTIVDHLVHGKTDSMRITFLPGATLRPNPATPEDQRSDVESALLRVGFKKSDIETAFMKQYVHPLLVGRPTGADIEGYMYGETYDFSNSATLDDIFQRVFDTYYAALQANDVIDALKQHNLSLYQGLTLASIVQREVSASDPAHASRDQQQVAQVFMTRLARGMPLGSDVTAYYGAIKAGEKPAVTVDTPYNTRIHAGLPPGPIATPSLGALEAVAAPAAGDYLFFLSGDDNVMYYAHTDAEHQANVKAHCQVKCAVS